MPPKLKSDTEKPLLGQAGSVLAADFILASQQGNLESIDILPFSGPLQLLSREQVLKLYFFIRDLLGKKNTHVSQENIAKLVAEKIQSYWAMAGFKTVVEFRVIKHIKKELDIYQGINKNRAKSAAGYVEKRKLFVEGLRQLFDIASPDLEETLEKSRILGKDDECTRYRVKEGYTRKSEDLKFLLDQRGERKMVMGIKDTSFECRVVNNMKRRLTSREEDSMSGQIEPEDVMDTSEENFDDTCDNNNDKDYNDKNQCKKYHKKQTVLVELPTDILNSPDLCSMLDRTGTTCNKAIGVVSSVLKSGKVDGKEVDLSQFKISKKTLQRKRVSNRTVNMEKEIEDFAKNKPKYAAAHWDGKLMKDVTGSLQEHESILVSGSPHYTEGKLLSVSKLVDEDNNPTSTGEAQALAVLVQLNEWGVDKNVVALVFDTTSSNSGVRKGATVRLQKALDRPVFFLACRHHVSELIIKACWYSLFEADLSPDCKFFLNIKEEWSNLDTRGEVEIVTLSKDLQGREEALSFYHELLCKKNKRNEMAIRDDYRELATCAMVVLGETPPSGKVVWLKPGACHKARFCAFGIYSLKALAFSVQLDLDRETVDALKQFCSFIAVVYVPHFLASSIWSDSTVNDLQLFKKLFEYRNVDSQLADEALVVLRRHCWYLTPEVAVFSLFSKKVSPDEKSRLASKLLSLHSIAPQSFKLEKPKFPAIDHNTRLEDLITAQSYKIFKILGVDSNWLSKPPEDWEMDETFKELKEFVHTVKVTNDVAERGIKLASDYATILTKNDGIRAELLQGVERCRRLYPDFKKSTLSG